MASINKVYLMGNLTRDPEIRYTSGGHQVCEFGLAINRRYRDHAGNDREDTCFVDITVWGKQAEACQSYLRRGSAALVDGRLHLDQWDDQSGHKRSKLRVQAERVQFLGAPTHANQDFSSSPQRDSYNQPATPRPQQPPPPFPSDSAVDPPQSPAGTDVNTSDDIPF